MIASVWILELVWTVVHTCRGQTLLAPKVDSNDYNEPLIAFIQDVEENFFCGSKQITISFDPKIWMIQEWIRHIRAPRRIFTVDTLREENAREFKSVQQNFYIFLPGKTESLREWLSFFPRVPQTPIALIVQEEASDVIQNVMAALWSAQFGNAVVVAINHSTVNAYSYVPYPPSTGEVSPPLDKFFSEISAPISVGSWDGRNQWAWKMPPFPRNQILNLNGRVLRCATGMAPWSVIWDEREPVRDIHGVSISLIEVLSEKINFTCKYQRASDNRSWGWVFKNGTSVGINGDIIQHRADLWVGDILPLKAHHDSLHLATPSTETCMTWAAPSYLGSLLSTWKIIVAELSTQTWAALFATLFLSTMFVYGLARSLSLREEDSDFRNVFFILVYQLSTMIQVPRKKPPDMIPLRAFFAIWFLFSIVMCTAYNAQLWSLLMDPWGRRDIATWQEILDAELNIRVHPNFRRMLSDIAGSNKTVQALNKKVVSDLDVDTIFRDIATKRTVATFIVRSGAQFAAENYNNKTVGKRVHYIPSCIIRLLSSPIALKKGSALAPQIDEGIQRIFEAGLLTKWEKKYTPIEVHEDERGIPISIHNIEGAFHLLSSGLFNSILAFFAERIWWKRTKRLANNATSAAATLSGVRRRTLQRKGRPPVTPRGQYLA